MIKRKIEQFEYVFNEEEFNTIKMCLGYCLHRARNHPESGINKISNQGRIEKVIDAIWKEIPNIKI